MLVRSLFATAVGLGSLWAPGKAAAAEAWYATPGQTWISFGIAENRETEYGLPLFVCESGHITVDAATAQERRPKRWHPPSPRTTVEISGRGPNGSFSSGAIPVTFTYNEEREMWLLTGTLDLANPLWDGLPSATSVQVKAEGKLESLPTAQLAEGAARFLTGCRKILGR